MWYAATPARAIRQAVVDVLVVAWVVAWVLIGRAVHSLVVALAGPARALQDAGSRVDQTLQSAASQVADVPLVGEQLADALRSAAGGGGSVSTAGSGLAESVERLALVLALVSAGSPILLVLLPWLISRLRFAAHNRAARRLVATPGGVDLMALRALTHRPPAQLTAVTADPVAAWRLGDPEVTARLAGMELRALGVGRTKLPVRRSGPSTGSQPG